ncbi:hypothetical protein FNV43_RR20987 [Rhamnella rubrinervis]|uniref:Uncharacterized protein n=1 Tax=Rhamnella rubrinervis TaxID=2594499 RepID=A0A8K0E0U4_9ROSA|nr:hypothetical protein FNV43_RR20987 [Rhamnella rubrinervis]
MIYVPSRHKLQTSVKVCLLLSSLLEEHLKKKAKKNGMMHFSNFRNGKRGCVKLHDVVRDVAISIASKEHGFVVICNNEIEDGRRLIQLLHQQEFNDNFLRGMEKLQVLAFRKIDIQSLPSPLEVLQNMRTLHLENCVLKDISSIGALVKLEILSLFGSKIQELPREIGYLQHLKLLDITQCKQLGRIPPGVLSSLTRLEELYMIVISDHYYGPYESRLFGNYLGFDGSDTKSMTECGIHLLLNKCEKLGLSDVKSLKNVTQLNEDGFSKLKVLKLRDCRDMEYLINLASCTHQPLHSPLEKLEIKYMDNLKGLCHPELLHLQRDPTTQFQLFYNLTSVDLSDCHKVQYVFSTSIPQLQSLSLWRCNEIEGVVYKETEESDDSNVVAADMIVFPKLASVRFLELRSLISLHRAMDDIEAKLVPFKCINWLPSLQSLYVKY